MNSKAAAPLTHELLARKGKAVAARWRNEADGANPPLNGQFNPDARPQFDGEDTEPSPRRPRIRGRYVLAAVLVALGAGVGSYLIFARQGLEPDRHTVTRDIPPASVDAAPPAAPAPIQTAAAPAPVQAADTPTPSQDLAPAAGIDEAPAPAKPAMETMTPPEPPAAPPAPPQNATTEAVPPPPAPAVDSPAPKKAAEAAKIPVKPDAAPPAAVATAAEPPAPAIAPPSPPSPAKIPTAETPKDEPKPAKTVPKAASPKPKPAPAAVAARTPTPVPAAKPATPKYTVQLASLRHKSAAEKEGARLQHRYGATLGGLPLTIEKASIANRGTFYRIKAGAFATARQAAAVCKALKAKKQPCLVVRR